MELNVTFSIFYHVFLTSYLDVENYSEDGKKLAGYSRSPSLITCSAVSIHNCKNHTIIAVGCADNKVYLLNSTTLFLIAIVTTSFKAIHLEIPGYEIKCENQKYFESITVESVFMPLKETFFVGFSNGFVKEYSLTTFEEIKTYNPIPLEYPKNNDETKIINIEDAKISGAQSLNFGHCSRLLFVNHKKSYINSQGQSTPLEETPISVFNYDGPATGRLKAKGDVLASKVLENRSLYMCLTSNNSELYVFNYLKNSLIMKTSFDIMKDPKSPLFFTGMAIHEFEISQRNLSVNDVFNTHTNTKEKIDGDVIIGVETSGSILIAKLTYENEQGKTSFAPLKYINAKGESKVPENYTILVSRVNYCAAQDKLLFTDQHSEVVVISRMLKTIFSEGAPTQAPAK